MIAWTLLHHPMTLSTHAQLWLLLPLLASVAIVYKTVRTDALGRLHIQVLSVIAYMVAGLTGLALALWLVHEYWPF